jgi:AcrR family transcriptional regulator
VPSADGGAADSASDGIRVRHAPFVPGPRAADTRGRLVAAAKELFVSRGFEATTVHDIVTRAGTSRASFYTYFATKEQVLIAVGDASLGEVGALVAVLQELPVPWDRDAVEAWVGDYLEFLDHDGRLISAWHRAADDDADLGRRALAAYERMAAGLEAAASRARAAAAPEEKAGTGGRAEGLRALSVLVMFDRVHELTGVDPVGYDRRLVRRVLAKELLELGRPTNT